MRSFVAFLKKEILENLRGIRLIIPAAIFVALGVMNTAIAALTPWLYEVMSDTLADSGMAVTDVTVNAITSWVQFFKNISMALIAFVLIFSGTLSKEYATGTLILVLTKGLSRYKIVLAKAIVMLSFWTAGYWLCFGITYICNAFLWDNSIAVGLAFASLCWWLFGVWTVCLTILFSTILKTYVGVLLGVGTSVLATYLAGMIPGVGEYVPTALMDGVSGLGTTSVSVSIGAFIITVFTCVVCICVSIPILNKKQI